MRKLGLARQLVLATGLLLFALWCGLHLQTLVTRQNGLVRFPLGVVLAGLILWRRRPTRAVALPGWSLAIATLAGALLVIAGLVLPSGLFEWTGLLLVVLPCLLWALTANRRINAMLAVLLLFWAHPLPSQIFLPLQLSMQALSVRLAEWFLHVCNVRVWADGFVLHTGVHIYEVPNWCSGMRTATTVVLVALGLGILRGLTTFRCFLLLIAALLQALFLNVLRISAMVVFAPRIGDRIGVAFLHDTAGIIMVAGTLLVYLELLLLEHLQRQRAAFRSELNPFWVRGLSEHPPIWRILIRYKWRIAGALAGTLLLAGLVYKSRPHHRAAMIKSVVEALRDTRQLDLAERAAGEVGSLVPNDTEWKLTVLRLLLIRGEYQHVIDGMNAIPKTPAYRARRIILTAYAYMGLDDLPTAASMLEGLPEATLRTDPRVAMILAEMARFVDNPEGVADRIATAAQWAPNVKRLRLLYPYLRRHRKWEAIMASDRPAPYTDIEQALCAAEASMNLNMVPRVADLTVELASAWPGDPRILEPLFFLSTRNIDSQWEARFARHALAAAERSDDPDRLLDLQAKCYQLGRPDLAWLIHIHIRRIDPTHPALLMDAVENARKWFTFRKRWLGMPAAHGFATVDLRLLYRATRHVDTWSPLHSLIPFGNDLCATRTVEVRKRLLTRALAEFKRRSRNGTLSLAMRYAYVKALEMDDRIGAAEDELAAIAADHPDQRPRTRVILSEIHERRGDWQAVYEVLRTYIDNTPDPALDLSAILRLSQSQFHLKLGIAAVHTARRAHALFPTSTHGIENLAIQLMRFDSPEEALLLLEKPRVRDTVTLAMLEAVALHRTQRFAEARRLCRTALLDPIPIEPGTMQRPYLPPAEVTMLWHQLFVPAEEEFAANARAFRGKRDVISSPFIEHLRSAWQACYEAHCSDGTADIELWLAGARDDIERATLLNQLVLLLCRDDKYQAAERAARRATECLPASSLLWRAAVGLAGPDLDTVRRARRACPDDSELWLADLVVTTQAAAGMVDPSENNDEPSTTEPPTDIERWVSTFITNAIADNTFSVAAFTRAGNYLQRGDRFNLAASRAAWYAADNARGLLPAYVLGLRAAIAAQDKSRALRYTANAIDASLRPPALFYEKLVGLKSAADPMDTDNEMVEALKVLRREDPSNPLWAQMLGYVRFQRGGWEVVDSLHQMSMALARGATNRTPYLIGAEAARLLDRIGRSTDLLQRGLERYPEDLEMLNNLTYTLALQPETVDKALDHLAYLLEKVPTDPAVLDTASAVYTRSGLLADAERTIEHILRLVEPGSRSWFRARTRSAEIMLLRRQYGEAIDLLRELIRQSTRMPDEDVLVATQLLQEAQRQQTREEPPTTEGIRL